MREVRMVSIFDLGTILVGDTHAYFKDRQEIN